MEGHTIHRLLPRVLGKISGNKRDSLWLGLADLSLVNKLSLLSIADRDAELSAKRFHYLSLSTGAGLASSRNSNFAFVIRPLMASILAQSKELHQEVVDICRDNDRLKLENDKLKKDVLHLYRLPRRTEYTDPNLAAQIEHLFRQNVERQAEIDSLKTRLAQAGDGRRQRPNLTHTSIDATAADGIPIRGCRKRKRAHGTKGSRSTRDRDANASNKGRLQHRISSQKLSAVDRGAEDIPCVTEDGADYDTMGEHKDRSLAADIDGSPNARLRALLSPLSMQISNPPLHRSNAKHAPRPIRELEDNEPLRSRPPHSLDLTYFRVNPIVINGMFQGVDRDKGDTECLPKCTKPECCSSSVQAVAKLLSADSKISEDGLLAEVLSESGEEAVSGLTRSARTSLLLEANARSPPSTQSRGQAGNLDTPCSPVGYWDVELPGSQATENHQHQEKL